MESAHGGGGGGGAVWVWFIFACRWPEAVCVCGEQKGVNLKLSPRVQIGKCSVAVCLRWNSWLFVNLASWSHWTKLQRTWTLVDEWGLGNWSEGCVRVSVCVCLAYSLPPGSQSWAIGMKWKDGPTAAVRFFFFFPNLKHFCRKFSKAPRRRISWLKIQYKKGFNLLFHFWFNPKKPACWFQVTAVINSKPVTSLTFNHHER